LNFPIAIAGSLTLLAFVAHITGGIKQSIAFALAAIYFLWGLFLAASTVRSEAQTG